LSSEERKGRIGLNETIFRDLNQRLQEVTRDFGFGEHELDLVCECGNVECVARITVPIATYEEVRSDSQLFVVAPGHEELDDVERIVQEQKGYHVVEKKGLAARVAELRDPND
jgi:hypothetical protein